MDKSAKARSTSKPNCGAPDSSLVPFLARPAWSPCPQQPKEPSDLRFLHFLSSLIPEDVVSSYCPSLYKKIGRKAHRCRHVEGSVKFPVLLSLPYLLGTNVRLESLLTVPQFKQTQALLESWSRTWLKFHEGRNWAISCKVCGMGVYQAQFLVILKVLKNEACSAFSDSMNLSTYRLSSPDLWVFLDERFPCDSTDRHWTRYFLTFSVSQTLSCPVYRRGNWEPRLTARKWPNQDGNQGQSDVQVPALSIPECTAFPSLPSLHHLRDLSQVT